MIPISLKLQGIYSYKKLQEIDFTKLTEASIFGIFGKVGSGKSAILEAIMLALYGEVARIKRTENRNYNIMNLDSDYLYIDFVFESGEKQYRSEVRGARNRKKFEKIETFNTIFYEYEPLHKNWTPKENFDPAVVLGLTIDDFRKTVILPQNSFQDFLFLNKSDRTDMMKRLFRLEKYDLAEKARELELKNISEIDGVKGALQQIGPVELESLQQREAEAAELGRQISEWLITLRQMREEENKLAALNKKFTELSALQEKKRAADDRQPAVAEQRRLLERYLAYAELFKIPFFEYISLEKEAQKSRADAAALQTLLSAAGEKLSLAAGRYADWRVRFDQRGQLKTKAEDLAALLEIKKLNALQEERKINLHKGTEIIEQARGEVKIMFSEIEEAAKEKSALEEKRPDLNELYALKNWFNSRQTILLESERLKKEALQRSETVREIETSKKVLIHKDLPLVGVQIPDTASLAEAYARVKDARQRIALELEEARQRQSEWSAALKFESAAAELSPGRPCPVCGSVHHPAPLIPSDVRQHLDDATEKITALKKTAGTAENIANQLETNLSNYNLRNEERLRDLKLVREQEIKDLVHLSNFVWKDFAPDRPEAADEALNDAVHWQNTMKALDDRLEGLKVQTEKIRGNIERYQQRLQVLNAENSGFTAATETWKNQIKTPDIEEYQDFASEKIQELIKNLLTEHGQIEKSYLAAESELNALQRENDVLSGKKEEADKRLREQTGAFNRLKENLLQKLAETGLGDLKTVEAILAENRDVGKEQKQINEYFIERETLQAQIFKLDEELKHEAYHPGRLESLAAETAALETEQQRSQQRKGALETEISQIRRSLKETAALRERLHALEIRGEHIKTLKSLFREKGFVNYVSSLYLRNLCAAANERFKKLTRQRLSLELTDDNNFKIIDVLNRGRERHIKTLSGGQTFQAALCLALALADSVQPRTGSKQNFFFLDEGFGSLDRESLATVFETLKSLRLENRIVGVISHVEEMQQEMERYLVVTNGEEGSVVEMF